MKKQKMHNKGFSFIELLIAMTIFSIVMLMVVEFMSLTSGAYRKTKKNVNIQTEALQVMEQMSDTLMQAAYIRVSSSDDVLSEIEYDSSSNKHERVITDSTTESITYDLVPDNYINYLITGDPVNLDEKVILNMSTYDIVDKKGDKYPNYDSNFPSKSGTDIVINRDTGLTDSHTDPAKDKEVKSFRRLNDSDRMLYVQPDYIYMEYYDPSTNLKPANEKKMIHVMYKIVTESGGKKKIYMIRYTELKDLNDKGFKYAVETIDSEIAAGTAGVVTTDLKDFYLSVDVKANALLANALFSDKGYEYNAVETINFRNSNVLSVRPQHLNKLK